MVVGETFLDGIGGDVDPAIVSVNGIDDVAVPAFFDESGSEFIPRIFADAFIVIEEGECEGTNGFGHRRLFFNPFRKPFIGTDGIVPVMIKEKLNVSHGIPVEGNHVRVFLPSSFGNLSSEGFFETVSRRAESESDNVFLEVGSSTGKNGYSSSVDMEMNDTGRFVGEGSVQ